MCKIEVYRVCLVIILKCIKLWLYIFTVYLKCAKNNSIPLNIYPHNTLHNNLKYIVQSYTLLNTINT